MKQKLMTNDNRAKRGFSDSTGCVQCGNQMETGLHVLRDCPKAREIWNRLIPARDLQTFLQLQWDNWMERVIDAEEVVQGSNIRWSTVLAIACWYL